MNTDTEIVVVPWEHRHHTGPFKLRTASGCYLAGYNLSTGELRTDETSNLTFTKAELTEFKNGVKLWIDKRRSAIESLFSEQEYPSVGNRNCLIAEPVPESTKLNLGDYTLPLPIGMKAFEAIKYLEQASESLELQAKLQEEGPAVCRDDVDNMNRLARALRSMTLKG